MWNSSFDFPRPRGMAIIWLLPYVGMQLFPLPLKITNQMRPLVMCTIHGTQTLMHTSLRTSSSLSYSTTTTWELMLMILLMLGDSKYALGWLKIQSDGYCEFEGGQTGGSDVYSHICIRIYHTFHLRPKYSPRIGAFEGSFLANTSTSSNQRAPAFPSRLVSLSRCIMYSNALRSLRPSPLDMSLTSVEKNAYIAGQ
jgi:hypothetical protein